MTVAGKRLFLLMSGLILALNSQSASRAQERIDLASPEGAALAMRKIQCSTVDNKPVYYWWHGRALSRRMGEPDRLLFNVEGMNVRMCKTVVDPVKGNGSRLVSREILLYTDPESGQPLETWQNPWTGQSVKVLHVENDPVNGQPTFPFDEQANPIAKWQASELEGRWWMTMSIPLFYHNVLQGDYQKQVGGAYHAVELFNYMGDLESLTDPATDSADVQVGWVRMSDWLPWMEMQGRDGVIYFHTAGKKVAGYDALSDVMKKYIEEKAPIFRLPPPSDDDRPNETSWTYFKKLVPGKRLPRGGAN